MVCHLTPLPEACCPCGCAEGAAGCVWRDAGVPERLGRPRANLGASDGAHPQRVQLALVHRASGVPERTEQGRELEAVAQRHGWVVVGVFADEGISGAMDGRSVRTSIGS